MIINEKQVTFLRTHGIQNNFMHKVRQSYNCIVTVQFRCAANSEEFTLRILLITGCGSQFSGGFVPKT
jgi:hypothetical protein